MSGYVRGEGRVTWSSIAKNIEKTEIIYIGRTLANAGIDQGLKAGDVKHNVTTFVILKKREVVMIEDRAPKKVES